MASLFFFLFFCNYSVLSEIFFISKTSSSIPTGAVRLGGCFAASNLCMMRLQSLAGCSLEGPSGERTHSRH